MQLAADSRGHWKGAPRILELGALRNENCNERSALKDAVLADKAFPAELALTAFMDSPPKPRIEHTAGGKFCGEADFSQSQFALVFMK